jgi:translation initiation factor IF-2
LSVQEFRLQEKVRVYLLARELNMESKDLLDLCRQAGIDVKNQLSSLDPDQRVLVEQLAKKGGGVAVAAPPKPATSVLPRVDSGRVRVLHPTHRREVEAPKVAPTPTPTTTPVREPRPAAEAPTTPAPQPTVHAPAAQAPQPPAVAEPARPTAPEVTPPVQPAAAETTAPPAAATAAPTTPAPDLAPRVPPSLPSRGVRDLSSGPRVGEAGARPRRPRDEARPVPTVRVISRPQSRQATPVAKKVEKAPEQAVQKPIRRLTEAEMREVTANPQGFIQQQQAVTPLVTPVVPVDIEEEEGDDKKGKVRPGQVTGRDRRHAQRSARQNDRKTRAEADLRGGAKAVLAVDLEEPRHRKSRHAKLKAKMRGPTQPRKGKVPVQMPITVRALSEAIGLRSGDLLMRLWGHGAPQTITINSTVEPELAETIALDVGCELEIKRPQDAETELLAGLQAEDKPEDLEPRAPVVTIMGHVDHGKTSLLDKIRQSNVAASEAGGITQVIRAWRVEHNGKPITFLDTPGHEAFTKMRARGAQVTDIAVIVVAADDGVMPQTEEAINHAKAAGVSMVVAINKVDLPNANVNKTRQQLYGLGVLPDNMGGDVPFVETSAATGKGIDDLLENILLVAELRELKANPRRPATGTCLEAMLSEGEGVLATLLVQNGTLHRGDVVICGASYGRVRALYNDLGQHIESAGPSVPVRITGLDEVPNADDPFQAVEDLAVAREIAEKRKGKQQEASLVKREPMRLENLSEAKIAELKVILKADFRGSIEAIRKELEKLQHEEVRVRILHAAIGGITESDVQLALTSPEDTIIVGFNVVPDDRARALAEERGIQMRQYNIIYNLTEDIKAALQGKLKPREEVVHLGRAVVRETFKISRVGTIAGCYVTQGTIERSARIRVIREGVVVYPPPDRTASLESLKHFKEDRREIREGFECGLKIAGYDDIKVGDVIEAYRVEQVQRTL